MPATGRVIGTPASISDSELPQTDAMELEPSRLDGRLNLGAALLQKGRINEAVAQFQEVVRLRPNDPDAQHNLATEQAAVVKAAVKK